MPIWAFQKRIIGNPTPEKAAFVSSFADCDELFVINQRFLKYSLTQNGVAVDGSHRQQRPFYFSKIYSRRSSIFLISASLGVIYSVLWWV